MAAYWPTAQSASEDPEIISHMNDSRKIVYSTTLASADWSNSIISHQIDAAAIRAWKQEAGKRYDRLWQWQYRFGAYQSRAR